MQKTFEDIFADARLFGIDDTIEKMIAMADADEMEPRYIIDWFYTRSEALGKKSPYQLCRNGKTDAVRREAEMILRCDDDRYNLRTTR